MFQCAAFPFADQRGAGEDDRQHGDIVDQLHNGTEPALSQIRVETVARHQNGKLFGTGIVPHKGIYLFIHYLLNVSGAGKSLRHARCIDIQLQFRRSSGNDIFLEIRRDDQNKGEFTPIHCRVDFGKRDFFGDGEHRRIKGIGQPLGQLRIVFIDDGDRRAGERIGSSLIGDIHTQRK